MSQLIEYRIIKHMATLVHMRNWTTHTHNRKKKQLHRTKKATVNVGSNVRNAQRPKQCNARQPCNSEKKQRARRDPTGRDGPTALGLGGEQYAGGRGGAAVAAVCCRGYLLPPGIRIFGRGAGANQPTGPSWPPPAGQREQ